MFSRALCSAGGFLWRLDVNLRSLRKETLHFLSKFFVLNVTFVTITTGSGFIQNGSKTLAENREHKNQQRYYIIHYTQNRVLLPHCTPECLKLEVQSEMLGVDFPPVEEIHNGVPGVALRVLSALVAPPA
jgi:hypothetical protein